MSSLLATGGSRWKHEKRVPSLRAAWVPSCTVLQRHFLWTTCGDSVLELCGHHIPTAAYSGDCSHSGACSSARHWLREQRCTGAQERHGRATGHVLQMLRTKAPLPGFCLDSTCQAYRSLGTCLCSCRHICDQGCTREITCGRQQVNSVAKV